MLCPHAPDSHRSHAISHQGGRGYDKGAVDGKIFCVLSDFDDINDSIALKNVAAKALDALRMGIEEEALRMHGTHAIDPEAPGGMFFLSHHHFWKRIRHCLTTLLAKRLGAAPFNLGPAAVQSELSKLKQAGQYLHLPYIRLFECMKVTRMSCGVQQGKALSLKAPKYNYADYGVRWLVQGPDGTAHRKLTCGAVLALGEYQVVDPALLKELRKHNKQTRIQWVLVRHFRQRPYPRRPDLSVLDFHGAALPSSSSRDTSMLQNESRYAPDFLQDEFEVIDPADVASMFTLARIPSWTDCLGRPMFQEVSAFY